VGLDVGRRRIGVAVSDRSRTLATPRYTIDGTGSVTQVVSRLTALVAELAADDDGVSAVVAGLPLHLDGRPHDEAVRVRAISVALEKRTGVPVKLQNERLTSVEAEQRLALRERDWRRRKARLDAAAAAIILQEYLDSQVEEVWGARSNPS
jgi:putative Holliday junction resolvase